MESIVFYFAAKEIVDEKKKKYMYLSPCGHKTFSILLDDIIVPEILQKIAYNNLLAKAKAYFDEIVLL